MKRDRFAKSGNNPAETRGLPHSVRNAIINGVYIMFPSCYQELKFNCEPPIPIIKERNMAIKDNPDFLVYCSGDVNPDLEPKRGDIIETGRCNLDLRPASDSIDRRMGVAIDIEWLRKGVTA